MEVGNALVVTPLFGKDFFEILKGTIKDALRRVFIGSAFCDKEALNELIKLKPKETPMYILVRDDNKPKGIEFLPQDDPQNNVYSIVVPSWMYHGKLYVVDNVFIVGSHNLLSYSVTQSEGEFSLMLKGDYDMVTAMLFKSLYLIFCKNSSHSLRYVDDQLGALYQWDECPFCGQPGLPDPFSIIKCPMYTGYVYEEECGEYRACKYCPYPYGEQKEPDPHHEIWLCIGDCGFGIDFTTKGLVYHHDANKTLKETVWEFIELFNGLVVHKTNGDIVAKMFRDLGFFGKIYLLDSAGDINTMFTEYFVSVSYFKSKLLDFIRAFIGSIENDIGRMLNSNEDDKTF